MGSYQRQRSRSTVGINLILGNGKHTRRKGQENVLREREREREMGKMISVDDRSKYYNGAFLNIFLALSLFCPC